MTHEPRKADKRSASAKAPADEVPDAAAPYPAWERATSRGRTVPSGTGPR
jgi:hypothetical protein